MINLVIMAGCLESIGGLNHTVRGDFLHGIIPVSARIAFEREKIDTLEKLSDYKEKEILQMHGVGKNTMHKLKIHMKEKGFSFRNI